MTGGARHLLTLLDNLDKTIYHPLVVTQRKSSLIDEVSDRGIEIIHLPLPDRLDLQDGQVLHYGIFEKVKSFFSLISYNNAIKKLIKDHNIDLVWTRNVKAVMFVGLASKFSGTPLIWDIGLEHESKGMVKVLHFFGLCLTSVVVTQGQSQHEQIFGNTLIRLFHNKLKNIGPGIDLGTIQNIHNLLTTVNISSRPFTILSVGIVGQRKNQMMLVKAIKQLASDYPDIKAIIIGPIGEENYYQEICTYISHHNLGNLIEFLGWRDDIPNFLVTADVFVMCSENEGVPRAMREALFAKLPVIGTKAGGIPDAVDHEKTGFLVALNDVDSLVSYLKFFIDNPEEVKIMGEAAYQLGKQKFSLEAWTENYQKLISSLV